LKKNLPRHLMYLSIRQRYVLELI